MNDDIFKIVTRNKSAIISIACIGISVDRYRLV